ncbi:MAG: phytoene desaturase family protein [Chitinispirillaceae bacterium]
MERAHMKKANALIIGAGLGGISAAISLAANGWNVTLAEKNSKIGGKLNLLRQDGFLFDLGPSLLTMPHVFEALFARAGRRMEDYVDLVRIPLQWRNFFEDGAKLDLHESVHTTADELNLFSPCAGSQFQDYCAYAHKQRTLAEEIYFRRGRDNVWDLLLGSNPLKIIQMDFFHSVSGSVKKRIQEPHIREIMNYFCKYVGSSPDRAPGFLSLLPAVQFAYGVHYVKRGMYGLAEGLHRLLEELEVEVKTGFEATELKSSRSGRVTTVTFLNGEERQCDLLLSNMEIIPFYSRVAGLADLSRSLERWFPPSCSGLVIHLGTDTTYPDVAHHNIFHSANPHKQFRSVFIRKQLPDDPTLYVVRPTKTDSSLAPEGCDIIKVLPQIPHLHSLRSWTPDDMNVLKESVLEKLERMGLTNLRKHIVSEKTLTPYDLRDMYYSNRGSIYGTVSDRWRNMAIKAAQRSRIYDNLFFVGGSVNPGGGMPMVVLSGMQVGDRIGKPL